TISSTHGIKALAHITGGGFPENIPRVLPDAFAAEVDLDMIVVPPVFSWLAQTGNVEPMEMLRTFNFDIGIIAVVACVHAAQLDVVLRKAVENDTTLGRIVPGRDDGVIFRGARGI